MAVQESNPSVLCQSSSTRFPLTLSLPLAIRTGLLAWAMEEECAVSHLLETMIDYVIYHDINIFSREQKPPRTLPVPASLWQCIGPMAEAAGLSVAQFVNHLLTFYTELHTVWQAEPAQRVAFPQTLEAVLPVVWQWKRPEGLECVYFVRAGETEFVKIGYTHHAYLTSRLAALQTGNMYELHLLAAISTAEGLRYENQLHTALALYRVRGEWFTLPRAFTDQLRAFTAGIALWW